MTLLLALSLLVMLEKSKSCSPVEGYRHPTIAERTRLSPLVIQAYVVAVDQNPRKDEYNATLNVTHVYKGMLNSSTITASGFGSSASCLSEVRVGSEYIVFFDVNPFRARYNNGISSAVAETTNSSPEIAEGLCCPRTTGKKPCFTHVKCILLDQLQIYTTLSYQHSLIFL